LQDIRTEVPVESVDILKRNLSILTIILFLLTVVSLVSVTNFTIIFLHLFLFFLSLSLLWRKSIKETIEYIGLGSVKTNILFTVLGLVSIYIAAIILNIILAQFNFNDSNKIVEIIQQLPEFILVFGVIFAPFSEELFFRAYLTRRLEFKFLKYSGVLMSAILFSIVHLTYGSVYEFFGTLLIGLILAIIYVRSKSITPCILIHMIFNLTSLLIIKSVTG